MKRGTMSLLFGAHQFIKHPIFVAVAFRILFGRWPIWREAVCIIIHDWGYWGCATMDGPDGTEHPSRGARIAGRLFGDAWYTFIAGHSRHYAKDHGVSLSPLFAADKLGAALEPWWTYLPVAILTGEVDEYIKAHGHEGEFRSRREWHEWVRGRMTKQACEYVAGQERAIIGRTQVRNGDT